MARVVAVLVTVIAAATACGAIGSSSSDRPATIPTIVDAPEEDREPGVGEATERAEPTDPEDATGTAEAGAEHPREEPSEGADDGPEGPRDEAAAKPAWAPTAFDPTGPGPAAWTVEILDRRPHDSSAFTQGLEIHDGALYESAGGYGESNIRLVDAETGEVIRSLANDPEVWAEGLTVVGDRAIQLTWRTGLAYLRDLRTFEVVTEFGYEGEGWGLCHDGSRLIMSDGSADLEFRDPTTFEVFGSVAVSYLGEPVDHLNELECVDGYVLANVHTTDAIAVIDPTNGDVVATIDASELALDATGGNDGRRFLNGMARLDETTFLMTGKYWPVMYRVRLVAAPATGVAPSGS